MPSCSHGKMRSKPETLHNADGAASGMEYIFLLAETSDKQCQSMSSPVDVVFSFVYAQ